MLIAPSIIKDIIVFCFDSIEIKLELSIKAFIKIGRFFLFFYLFRIWGACLFSFIDKFYKTFSFVKSFFVFASDIKIAHSIFALPVVLASLTFMDFTLRVDNLFFLVAAMVFARSFAMGMNRYLDRDIDSQNTRTELRNIPSGKLPAIYGLFWSLTFGAMFCGISFYWKSTLGYLSLIVLLILGFYPRMKRHSILTHYYLGVCLGLAPLGASLAIQGRIPAEILILGLAIAFWTGGFDILYALNDLLFDREHKLYSIPAALGVKKALIISRISFSLMIVCLILVGNIVSSGLIYYLGIFFIASILTLEHWLIRDSSENVRSSSLNYAFFNLNALVSVVYYAFTQLDIILKV